ncbi:MAG: zf-HC2 domain-containing protein [Deltaproteobacteria bacterium]|nr:zf-HC2 domain-containing protein [Deltaproteobacteria bacterium]
MSGCDETSRYLDAWLDGELDPGASLIVETHIARCAQCADEADAIRSIKKALASTREGHATPGHLRSKLLAALDAEDQSAVRTVQATRRKRHGSAFALAGAALAGIAVSTGWRGSLGGTTPVAGAAMMPPILEDIAQRHARNLPVEVSGAQPDQVSNFFNGRLDIPVRPVRFRGVSARLVGARISNVSDRMAAALYYDVEGRRVSVFMFDASVLPRAFATDSLRPVRVNNQPAYLGYVHGYTVVISERAGVGYAVASDMPPDATLSIFARAELQ